MPETKPQKTFDWLRVITAIALLICAFSLGFIAINLSTVNQWANYQNTCVEQESKKAPIEWAVRKCNGRSKVYQVK